MSRALSVGEKLCGHACACILAIGFGMTLGGCAAQKPGGQQASVGSLSAKPVAAPSRASSDDPREPWSPSYGTRPRLDDPAPSRAPAPIEAGSTRIATMDADAVIRQAVAQHEMRRP
jgi:hypothetical protein